VQLNQAAFQALAQLAEGFGVAAHLPQQRGGVLHGASGAAFAIAQAVQRLAQLVLDFLGVLQLLYFLLQCLLVFFVEIGFLQLI
jgi:hypothetical protein